MSQTTVPADEDRRDKRSGRFEQEFSDGEFVAALERLGGGGTGDVAREVGCDHNTAYKRLRKLRDAGRVESEEVGNSLRWESVGGDLGEEIVKILRDRQVVKTSILIEEIEGYSEAEIRDELHDLEHFGAVEEIKGGADEVWELDIEG